MTFSLAITGRAALLIASSALVTVLLVGVGSARAADSALAAPLCGVLKQLFPQVRTYRPEGAQSQLVMAIAEAFDYDPTKLRQVKAEIDQATSACCPKDRENMLGVLKMQSLAEAVR